MNTTAKALVFAITAVAGAAFFGTALAERTAPEAGIVKLERVVITGKRADAAVVTAQLPRVVILGRTVAHLDQHVATLKQISDAI